MLIRKDTSCISDRQSEEMQEKNKTVEMSLFGLSHFDIVCSILICCTEPNYIRWRTHPLAESDGL